MKIVSHNQSFMRLSLIQDTIAWADKLANLQRVECQLEQLAGQTDLVVLPEMFTTGFCTDRMDLAEDMQGPTVQVIRRWTAGFGLAVSGSFLAKEHGRYYNRAFLALPDGGMYTADKRYLSSDSFTRPTPTTDEQEFFIIFLILAFCIPFFYNGLKIVKPNEAMVLTLFGNYYGTILKEGFYFVNPFSANKYPPCRRIQRIISKTVYDFKISIFYSNGELSGILISPG